ncbi:MAG TPA: 2-dehydropantoate 2-reductase [Steroidobacteraceae bacterium]|jgi:2-dehydropantoate 2-reductase
MKILVMGAGGIGAYYGAKLKLAGEDVYFCARGEHLAAIKSRGLVMRGGKEEMALAIPATDKPPEFAPYDLILFCVKSYDTIAAAEQLKGTLAPGGVIMTLQNGVENESALCTIFPRESVMGGNARVGAEIAAPGVLVHSAYGYIEFGELDGAETPRALRLKEVFGRAGMLGQLTHDLRTIRWVKLMGNNGTNCVCALSRSSLGETLSDPDGYWLTKQLMLETVKVGAAEGAKMSPADAENALARLSKISTVDKIRPSTLQDVERGNRLEYDAITGAMIRAAERHGIEVPITRAMHALLKLIDQRIAASRG